MTELQENLNDLCGKFTDIYKLLNLECLLSQEEILKICELFVSNLKADTEVLKLFKDRDCKCFESVVFFNNEHDETLLSYLKTKDITDVIWSNLQLVVLLYELTHDGSKHLIKKLYKKIKVNDKLNKNDEKKDTLSDDIKNKMLEDLKKMIPQPKSTDDSKSVIKELLGDIKEKLKEKEKFEPMDIMNMTKDLSAIYQNKIQSGEMDIGNLLSGVLDLMKDPGNLSNEFSGIENKINSNPMELMQAMQETFKKEGGANPFDLLNNLSGGLGESGQNNGSNDLKNIMSMVNMVSQGSQNGNQSVNPLSLLSGGLGDGLGSVVGNLLEGDKPPESEEEIKKKQEMLEEYYKNLQI
jgi:hypothetical protein